MYTHARTRTKSSPLPTTPTQRPLLPSSSRVLVRQALRGGQLVQPVSQAADAFEHEAGRVADMVMSREIPAAGKARLTASPRQGNCATCQEDLSPATEPGVGTAWEAAVGPESASLGSGQPLTEQTRSYFEPRFGADFSGVNVHHDNRAAHLAQSIGARAFTYSNSIYFNQGEYRPDTDSGRHLLAHELTHVVQQQGTTSTHTGPAGLGVSRAPCSIQCDNGGGFQLHLGTGSRPWWQEPREPQPQLRLDPQLGAELMLMRMRAAQQLLDPANVRSSLLQLDPSLLAPSTPDWLRLPATPAPAPLVPAGAGPETPRAGTPGDVLRAIVAVPTVDTALTTLRTQATQRVSSDWQRLSTGERVLLISQGVLISGAALAGVFSNEQTRDWALTQLQGRDLPVPGVPGLSVQLNLTGPDRRVFFTLDLARLLAP